MIRLPLRKFGLRQRRPDGEPAGRAERHQARMEISVLTAAGEAVAGIVHDLSLTGFAARLETTLPVGSIARVLLPSGRSKHFRVVRRDAGELAGEFIGPLEPGELEQLLRDMPEIAALA